MSFKVPPKKKKPVYIKLIPRTIKRFKAEKVVSINKGRVNSLDFSDDGKMLVSSSDDESVSSWDCHKATPTFTLNSHKYGANLVRFTRCVDAVFHASTKLNDSLRHLSLKENKYIRYYPGHTRRVVSLCRSPKDDLFISTSLDKSIRVWDLRTPTSVMQGSLHMNRCMQTATSFDPKGTSFALAADSTIKLFDLKFYKKGPFAIYKMPRPQDYKNVAIKISSNGKMILLTLGTVSYIIDAFNGNKLYEFGLPGGTIGKFTSNASLSPCSNYLFIASSQGRIYVFRTKNGKKITELTSVFKKPIICTNFNPKLMLLVTASYDMTFWAPV